MENGLTAFGRGDYSSAALSFILAARVNQGDAAARIHAAHAMFALGRHREAIPFLRRAFELQPLIAQLPLDMREDYGRKEDFVEQLHALEDAVAANSDDDDLRLLLGYSHLYSRNPAQAYRVLAHASQLRPDDEITLASECIDLRDSRSRPEIGIVTTRSLLTNQRDELVMDMSTTYMVKRRLGDGGKG